MQVLREAIIVARGFAVRNSFDPDHHMRAELVRRAEALPPAHLLRDGMGDVPHCPHCGTHLPAGTVLPEALPPAPRCSNCGGPDPRPDDRDPYHPGGARCAVCVKTAARCGYVDGHGRMCKAPRWHLGTCPRPLHEPPPPPRSLTACDGPCRVSLHHVGRHGPGGGPCVGAPGHPGPCACGDCFVAGVAAQSAPPTAQPRVTSCACDCDLRDRAWDPNTGRCRTCRRHYVDPRDAHNVRTVDLPRDVAMDAAHRAGKI